jgi:hypothetical protein
MGASISGYCQSKASWVATIFSPALRDAIFSMAHFNGTSNQNLVVDASALAACPTADAGLVDLDMLVRASTDPIPDGTDHSSAELVENLKGSFVARKPELPLELDG